MDVVATPEQIAYTKVRRFEHEPRSDDRCELFRGPPPISIGFKLLIYRHYGVDPAGVFPKRWYWASHVSKTLGSDRPSFDDPVSAYINAELENWGEE